MIQTVKTYDSVKTVIPYKKIIITEAGWPTYTEGDLHFPQAGNEVKQKQYFFDLMKWSEENNVIVFNFEAFDEPWKGTGTEGHWGLFSVNRKAKLAMQELYPELMPDGPTSPDYD
jgi:exo-beta-1,3-glucanase (GH17 family)